MNNFLVVTAPTCDWPIYPLAFVLRPSAKLHRRTRKTIVAKTEMASMITSATVFVSSTSTTSASRPRPPATTNRQSFNLLTATTRLTRSLLQSVRSQVARPSVMCPSSRRTPDRGPKCRRATPNGSVEGLPQLGCEPAPVLAWIEQRHCRATIHLLGGFLAQTGERCTTLNA